MAPTPAIIAGTISYPIIEPAIIFILKKKITLRCSSKVNIRGLWFTPLRLSQEITRSSHYHSGYLPRGAYYNQIPN